MNGHQSALSECACIFIVRKEWIAENSGNLGAIECPRKSVCPILKHNFIGIVWFKIGTIFMEWLKMQLWEIYSSCILNLEK